MKTLVGTAFFIAPEVYNYEYTEKCDIWSAGVILYIMLCGYPPFWAETNSEISRLAMEYEFEFDENEGWAYASEQVKSFISSMLVKE